MRHRRPGASLLGDAGPPARAIRAGSHCVQPHRDPNPRHAGDAVRLVLALVALLLTTFLAHQAEPGIVEVNLFRLINELPGAFGPPLLGAMQLGALAAVPAVALVALLGRRPRLAPLLLLGGGAAWTVAKALQLIVDQEPPEVVLRQVTLHSAVAPGLAFPATHVAVVAALATVAGPYVARPSRRLGWAAVAVVAVARVYVGAHFPVDVLGGAAVGWAVGSVVHLAVGTPRGVPGRREVVPALRRAGISVAAAVELPPPDAGSALFRVETTDRAVVAAKVVSRDQPEADWLYRVWRLLAYREVEDELTIVSPRHRVDHEAYVLLALERGGVQVPPVIATTPLSDRGSLLVRGWVEGRTVPDIGDAVDDRVLADMWAQVRALHRLGAAHGTLRADHFVVDAQGRSWLIELGSTRFTVDDDDQLRDIAELCASTATVLSAERVVKAAVDVFGSDRVAAALPLLQPLTLSPPTRRRLSERARLLETVRAEVAHAGGFEAPAIEAPARVAARNLAPLLGGLFLVNLLLPQVGQARATLDALHRAHWIWLTAVVGLVAGSYLMGAVALLGAAGRRLALGRTWAVQVASAFTNRLAPAGLGGMRTNVRYLEAAGVSRPQAVTAVGLRAIGAVGMHLLAAVAVAIGARRTHLRWGDPDLPPHWAVLVGVVVALAAAGLVRWGGRARRRVAPGLREGWHGLAAALRHPPAAIALLSGCLGGTLATAAAFVVTAHAFDLPLPVVSTMAVYLGGSAVGSLAPTPGGLGGVEAALAAGLTVAGASTGPAVATVLTFRALTYWLPVLPGVITFRLLQRNGIV